MKTHANNACWFILGQAPLVSLAELFSLYTEAATRFDYVSGAGAALLTVAEPPNDLKHIAGTVKVGRAKASNISFDDLPTRLADLLDGSAGKVEFGVSVYGQTLKEQRAKQAFELGLDVKKILVAKGLKARFVDNRGEAALSSASVFHNKLLNKGTEFLVIENNGLYSVAVTTAVQPFEEFSERDFGRPGRDDKSGMLPPKLAQMMLHMANTTVSDVLLDPFCGSGTILTEALLQGYTNLIGSDLSDKAIEDTKKNVDWTLSRLSATTHRLQPTLFQSDVRVLATKIDPVSINIIVTEPYMGPPLHGSELVEQVKKTCNELADLYTEAFKNFSQILAPGASVVFILPRFFIKGSWHTISDKIVGRLKDMGFEKSRLLPEAITPTTYVLYHRPGQFVGREIWRFVFNK